MTMIQSMMVSPAVTPTITGTRPGPPEEAEINISYSHIGAVYYTGVFKKCF